MVLHVPEISAAVKNEKSFQVNYIRAAYNIHIWSEYRGGTVYTLTWPQNAGNPISKDLSFKTFPLADA